MSVSIYQPWDEQVVFSADYPCFRVEDGKFPIGSDIPYLVAFNRHSAFPYRRGILGCNHLTGSYEKRDIAHIHSPSL